ncbi:MULTISPECIES: DUF461 domain-containing protein [unclassified Streptomyces]|uniref:DUF461 domain-containing protein n=1 Tax=unclassified Streptomyces TaxID=2593676 RepID=UPI002E2B2946|nr:DUF461 domain-containing protein [Streptomyces sp. NBC_01429]
MSRSLRRGALAASALVFSLASLTACGAGNNAQTLGVKPDSAATSVGDITIQNATVVTQPQAASQGPAVLTGTVFNNGKTAQTLDSVKLPGTTATVKLVPAKGSGPIEIPSLGSVQLGGQGNASAVIDKGREAAKDGDAQQVVFSFSETGEVGLRALVFPSDSYFKDVGPSTLPSASPSTSAKPGAADNSSDPAAGDAVGSPSESGDTAGDTAH